MWINMFLNFLSTSENSTPTDENLGQLAIQYGLYLLVIIVGLILIALIKKRHKKTLKPEVVIQNCNDLKNKINSVLDENKNTKNIILNQGRLMQLCSLAEEAVWNSSRLVDEGHDMVFDEVTTKLDVIANNLSEIAANAFGSPEERIKQLRNAVVGTDAVLNKINQILLTREGK